MSKYSYEEKIKACEDYFSGERSATQIANDFGLAGISGAMKTWFTLYREHGPEALFHKSKNTSYSRAFKIRVVKEYVSGKASLNDLIAKFKIPSTRTLRDWIKLYNSYKELKDYDPKQEVYMAEARRKTTINERKDIVKYCIEHSRDYKGTAEKYDVSYSQVYSWMKKYDTTGEDGLADKRGHHKSDEEVCELEKLRRENNRLKRQLEERDMTVELLKKVKEFERRRF